MRDWAKNNPEKKAEFNKQWTARNPEKYYCHNVLNAAIPDKKLIKSTSCQTCGTSEGRIHGHHPDYTKPLDVMWLCATCHSRQHRLEREQLRSKDRVERHSQRPSRKWSITPAARVESSPFSRFQPWHLFAGCRIEWGNTRCVSGMVAKPPAAPATSWSWRRDGASFQPEDSA